VPFVASANRRHMSNLRVVLVSAYVLVGVLASGEARLPAIGQPGGLGERQNQPQSSADDGFRLPSFVLEGNLAKIFVLSKCEYISGITCSIHYNGVLPLPSQVFFTEFDEHGHQAGARVRLIYPELKPGERGAATFRTRSAFPSKIVLHGEWKGPWRNPY